MHGRRVLKVEHPRRSKNPASDQQIDPFLPFCECKKSCGGEDTQNCPTYPRIKPHSAEWKNEKPWRNKKKGSEERVIKRKNCFTSPHGCIEPICMASKHHWPI